MENVWKSGDTITADRLNGNIAYTTSLTYTGDDLTGINESIGGTLRRRTTLTYTSGDLTGINVKVYDTDGTTIIEEYNDTLTYTSDDLTSTARVVVT